MTKKQDNSVNLVAELAATFDMVAGMSPAEKARTAHKMWTQLLECQALVAKLRTSAVRELRTTHTLRQIAADLDLSVTRVRQIEDYAPDAKAVASGP